MDTIQDILTELGKEVATMDINESITLKVPAFENLIIEKIDDNRLSVAQVYTQRGDLMRDPEVVFDTSGEKWVAVMYQNDPHEYKQDDSGLPDVQKFCDDIWNKNLRHQGFIKEAQNQAAAP